MSTEHSNAKKGFARGTKQLTLAEATRETTETDGAECPVEYPFEEYGPTARKPVPIEEENFVPGGAGVDYRELPDTGLAPSDYEILSGVCHPRIAAEYGFHPDDRIDPNAHEKHGEAMARAAALEQADDGGVR